MTNYTAKPDCYPYHCEADMPCPRHEVLECLDRHDGKCEGLVEYRIPMSGTGKSFPRCDYHMQIRWATQERLSRTYGVPLTYDGSDYSDYDY